MLPAPAPSPPGCRSTPAEPWPTCFIFAGRTSAPLLGGHWRRSASILSPDAGSTDASHRRRCLHRDLDQSRAVAGPVCDERAARSGAPAGPHAVRRHLGRLYSRLCLLALARHLAAVRVRGGKPLASHLLPIRDGGHSLC